MKRFTKLTPALALFASVGLLAGCATSQSTTSSSTPAPASSSAPTSSSSTPTPTPVDPWAVPSDYVAFDATKDPKAFTAEIDWWDTFGSSGATASAMKLLITNFNKIYPNIKVTRTSKDSYPNIASAIQSAIPSGTTPTMAIGYPDNVARYIDKGAIENLAGYAADATIGFGKDDGTGVKDANGVVVETKADLISAYVDEGTSYAVDGVYSLPFSKSTEVMFYNKDQFDANGWTVPTTWTELWSTAEAMKTAVPTVTPLGYDSDDNLFITRSAQSNIAYTSLTGDHYLFNNAQAKAMVGELKTNYDKGYFKTKGTSANNAYTSTQFTSGSLMMTVGSTGGTSYNYTQNFNIGIAAIPQADTNNKKVISQGPSAFIFKRATADQKYAAWLFYKYITNSSNSAYWSSKTGYNPVRTSSYSSSVWTEFKNSSTSGSNKLIFDTLEFIKTNYVDSLFTSPAFVGSDVARTSVGGLVTNVLLGTKDVNTAFEDAIAQCLFVA
jgi:multiple sugar transport system substrate-binding protein